MKEHGAKIVADGAQRLRDAKDCVAVRQRILLEVRRRYDEEKKGASLWRRVALEVKIRREVAAEMKKEFPTQALYLWRFSR